MKKTATEISVMEKIDGLKDRVIKIRGEPKDARDAAECLYKLITDRKNPTKSRVSSI